LNGITYSLEMVQWYRAFIEQNRTNVY